MLNLKLVHLRLLERLGADGANLSAAARSLGLSQPSASRLLAELEQAMGGPLLRREGKRFIGLTPLAEEARAHVRRIVEAERALESLAQDKRDPSTGELRIATTHAQARHFLPAPLKRFRKRWPDVRLRLVQGMPETLAALVVGGEADVAVFTEGLGEHPALKSAPCYAWTHVTLSAPGPTAGHGPISMAEAASEPVLTYVPGISGRRALDEIFEAAGHPLRVALEAADADVLKTFARSEFGRAIVSSMAFDPAMDSDLVLRPFSEATPKFQTRAAWLRERPLRRFEKGFLDFLREESVKLEERMAAAVAQAAEDDGYGAHI